MQAPTLGEALAEAASSRFSRIVVQPHLLFHGLLYDEIQAAVDAHRCQSQKEWIVTSVLGPELEMADAVMDLMEHSSIMSIPRAIKAIKK
jgi:sirohydrochlorin ferrochelatase